ncbi:MAG: hypothetical protein AB1422_08830 [bacterium]
MNKETSIVKKESKYLFSFIDVMYGVILGIGFSNFEKISSAMGYILFFFTYIVVVSDWIIVHETDFEKPYSETKWRFATDTIILFVIYKLIYTSSSKEITYYWIWVSGLFILYSFWDILLFFEHGRKKAPTKVKVWIITDSIGVVIFVLFAILVLLGLIPYTLLTIFIPIIGYGIIMYFWYKKYSENIVVGG